MYQFNEHTYFICIDPLKAFTTQGTFGKVFSKEELKPIEDTFKSIDNCIKTIPSYINKIFVRSIYDVAQFTDGDLDSPMACLCSADNIIDREWAIHIPQKNNLITKYGNDLTESHEFKLLLPKILKSNKTQIIITGCTITSCIKQTSLSLAKIVNENKANTQLIVPSTLTTNN